MSKAKVHLLQDLLSGEVGVVDQITLGTETMFGSLDISELKRFRPGNILQNASECAVYGGLPYQWTGAYPKTISVESPGLEQGWKSVEYKMNSETALISVISMQITERGYTFTGTFDTGCVVDSATDAVIDLKTGKWWVYTGTLPYTVEPRTSPDGQWTDGSSLNPPTFTKTLITTGTTNSQISSGLDSTKYVVVDAIAQLNKADPTASEAAYKIQVISVDQVSAKIYISNHDGTTYNGTIPIRITFTYTKI